MIVAQRWRKLVLAIHVTTSVSWIGAVIAFIAVAALGLTASDTARVAAAYLMLDPIARLAILPLALGCLASGLLSSLISQWGLFRHHWIMLKLAINLFALVVLVTYLPSLARPAELASTGSASPLLHGLAALMLLLVALALSIYKPRAQLSKTSLDTLSRCDG